MLEIIKKTGTYFLGMFKGCDGKKIEGIFFCHLKARLVSTQVLASGDQRDS